ncbi:hypothetical protein DMI65_06625 [Escherichia coli]|nr:hypothetical protein [Escherichia coli]
MNGFNGDATDNITLAGSNIINGGIETIVIAKENKGTHTVNLNIKDGSIIGAANNKQTIYASASAQRRRFSNAKFKICLLLIQYLL